jgi:hypothetical protein
MGKREKLKGIVVYSPFSAPEAGEFPSGSSSALRAIAKKMKNMTTIKADFIRSIGVSLSCLLLQHGMRGYLSPEKERIGCFILLSKKNHIPAIIMDFKNDIRDMVLS